MTAEEVLLFGQNELSKVFDEVNSHLENCIEKLLGIKVQLLSEQTETNDDEEYGIRSLKEVSGSECNRLKFGNNLDGDEEGKFVRRGKANAIDAESKHAIQGNSSVRSSPFLEPFSSSTAQSSLSRHCNDEEQGEEGKGRQVEQTNHDDHYYLEGLKQKEDSLSTSTTEPSCISQPSVTETNFAGDPPQLEYGEENESENKSENKCSTNSFEDHVLLINSALESDDPSNYVVNSTLRKLSLTVGKPPIPSPMSTVENVMRGDESKNQNMTRHQKEVPQLMMKSYSNEEIIFRMADERHHQQLGHVPQDHNWIDYSARLSLPSLDPPENFRDNVSTHELAPPPTACMIRTPELVNIMRDKSTEVDEEDDVMSDAPVNNNVRPWILKQDSSETKTTSSCDRFDTASSEIYFSQDGNSPPGQSLSESPPLFVATVNKPPLALPSPTSSSAPNYRKRTSYPKINIPIGINLSIRISHVNDPSDFWIHVNRDQVNMLFNEIQLLQEKFVQSNQVAVRTPAVGSMYATRYSSDVSWYRVEVIESLPNSYVEILFIDYGFTIKANSTDLSILNPMLGDKPAQAFNCFLKGVQAPTGKWTGTAIEEFKNSVSFYSVRAIFYDVIMINNHRPKYPVDLFLDWGSGEMNNVLLYLSPTEFITNEQLNM